MVANYRTMTLNVVAGENIVTKIYEILKEEGYTTPHFILDFIGFQADIGTSFSINGNQLKVPNTGYFITPYGESTYLAIHSVVFDENLSNIDFYIIY